MRSKSDEEESKEILRASFLEVVENQLLANDPPETLKTLNRLIGQGTSITDAKIYIAQAVCVEMFGVMKHHIPYNQKRYIRNLQRLPKEPKELY